MADYTYGPQPAVDITTAQLVTAGGLTGQVYASEANAQAGTSPLTVTLAGGVETANVPVSSFGQTAEFVVADLYQVWWRSGAYIVHLMSFDGMLANQEANLAATLAAKIAAEAALAAVEAYIAAGGGSGGGGESDHGALSGLDGDDHPQYYNQIRGDARYNTKTVAAANIAAAVEGSSTADRARGNHSGFQGIGTIDGLSAALTSRIQGQIVVNGTEERPEGSEIVFWIGGSTLPENIGPKDVHLAGVTVGPGDSTPPGAPGKPVASGVAATSLTLTWTAATDDVGVTGYRVRVNGVTVLSGSPAGLTRLITSLDPSTDYTFEVAARDANSNWGPYSTPSDEVTTSASGDTTDPTPPTTVTPSAITASGFTLTWSGAADDVGVTGYRVLIDGVQYATPSGTTQNVTGRTANTAYDVTIEARDAAGNWSAPSDEIVVTTESGGSLPTHSVFASPPGALVKTVEASAYEHATGFYTHSVGANGWKVKGARLYVPVGISVPATCEVNLYAPGTGAPTLGTPTKTVTMTGITSGAWNTVNFPSVTEVDSAGEVFWIGIKFADGTWLGIATFSESFVAAADGSTLVLSDRVPNVGLDRNYRRIGTGATAALVGSGERDAWFGMDVIVEED